jgi:hypothetical protein
MLKSAYQEGIIYTVRNTVVGVTGKGLAIDPSPPSVRENSQ